MRGWNVWFQKFLIFMVFYRISQEIYVATGVAMLKGPKNDILK